MAGLSLFMKRRIQQLVDEYQDPRLVLEQIQNASEELSKKEEEEIVEYLDEICSETPYEEMPLANNAIDFLHQLLGEDGDISLPDLESGIMEEMLDIVESGFEQAQFLSISTLENLADKFNDRIRIPGEIISEFSDTIKSLPILNDAVTLSNVMIKDKIQLKMTKSGELSFDAVKKLYSILSDSPYIRGTKPPRKKNEIPYLMNIVNLMNSAGFLELKNNIVISPDDPEKAHEISRLDSLSLYGKMLKVLLFDDKKSDFQNLFKEIGPYSMEFTLFYSILSIGEEWKDFYEGMAPILADGNSFVREGIAHCDIDPVSLRERIKRMGFWLSDSMEKMAIWEMRNSENDQTEIRLTPSGRKIIENLASQYPVPCRIYGKILASKSASDYVNYLISTNHKTQMRIRNSELYNEYMEANRELDDFYMDFIEFIIKNPENIESRVNGQETEAEKITGNMKKSITRLNNFMRSL